MVQRCSQRTASRWWHSTLRYDRLDNFWFVLFHELAHVFLHLTQGLRFDFFDEEEGDKLIRSSRKRKLCAERLMPRGLGTMLVALCQTEEAVSRCGGAWDRCSIIAGRIRKERNDYTLLTRLVGQDAVRKQLEVRDGK